MEKVQFLSAADVQDAFHRMEITMWLSRYFGMPAVRAGDVGEFADGWALNPDDLLTYLPRGLLSWSLFFAQEVDEEAVSDVLPRALLLRDRGRPMVLSLDRDAQETPSTSTMWRCGRLACGCRRSQNGGGC